MDKRLNKAMKQVEFKYRDLVCLTYNDKYDCFVGFIQYLKQNSLFETLFNSINTEIYSEDIVKVFKDNPHLTYSDILNILEEIRFNYDLLH